VIKGLAKTIGPVDWSRQLDQLFASHADTERGVQMSRYLRDQFFFHGLMAGERRKLQKQHEVSCGIPEDPFATASALWALPARECQLVAVDIVNRHAGKLDPSLVAQELMVLVQSKSWWDTVDLLATTALGTAFKHRKTQSQFLPLYRNSSDMWMRRCAILFQLKYRDKINRDLMFDIVDENLGSKEFFINKAIGWALRQHAKIDRPSIEEFVGSRDLSGLSKREALR